jgi:hypothetical protein
MWRKYLEFRKNPGNDDVTDGMWCGQMKMSIKDLVESKQARPAWAAEVLTHKRSQMAEHMAAVDAALIEKAKAGDTRAAELLYRRFENWTPKQAEAEMKRNPTNKTFAELIAEGGA